ncbi:MAG: tetratricopeptide repeat protein [Candidatus Margulisiibacteriota bacterium]
MTRNKLLIGTIILLMATHGFGATIVGDTNDTQVLSEQKMLIDSLKKFVDDNPTAADEMEYIIQKKEDVSRKKMNDMLEKMAGDDKDKSKDEALTGGALDYVTRKLNLALVYFYESKYWLTIEECNNVIKVSPKSTLAWIRRGSAYYMQSNYEQAKTDWTLALGMNPKKSDKQDLERFLSKVDTLIAQEL